jgi:putative FmdB family regulatory protein
MATYEYKCSLDHIYVEERPITEDQIVTKCPKCNSALTGRQIKYTKLS